MSKIVVSIVTNEEEDYFEYALNHIYDFADKIIIIHGEAYDPNPTDLTHTGKVIESYSDPEGKIIKRYLPKSFPDKKNLSFQLALEEGFDWYFTLDSDEFYTVDDLKRIRTILDEDKDTLMFLMEYFAFCYNFNTGYWDTVNAKYPQSERIWRYTEGMHPKADHCERFLDKNNVPYRSPGKCKRLCLKDNDIMMYHMTFVKAPEKVRARMTHRLGRKDGDIYFDRVLNCLRRDNMEEIYQRNVEVRGVYGIHWIFPGVILSPFSGRPLPEVLRNHPRKDIDWEV